jgi:hypothetical protein
MKRASDITAIHLRCSTAQIALTSSPRPTEKRSTLLSCLNFWVHSADLALCVFAFFFRSNSGRRFEILNRVQFSLEIRHPMAFSQKPAHGGAWRRCKHWHKPQPVSEIPHERPIFQQENQQIEQKKNPIDAPYRKELGGVLYSGQQTPTGSWFALWLFSQDLWWINWNLPIITLEVVEAH